MNNEQFWQLIADSRRDFDANRRDGNMDLQVRRMKELLSALPGNEIQDFERIFFKHSVDAYRWDLWNAAYIILGGCSDDGFEYFRRWLISMGREIFEAALVDPQSLTDIADQPGIEVCEFEEFGSIASEVLEEMGEPEPDLFKDFQYPREPIGSQCEDADLPSRYPLLWAKFGDNPRG